MTFFLSGLYLLPESKKRLYDPPNNPRGASDIGYLTDEHVKATLTNVRRAWLEGHEIGTHFNGHFCSGYGTVGNWTPAQWRSEIAQAKAFVKEWRTNTGWTDLPALPFDYEKELVGGRTPCLLGQNNLLPTARELGWRYDASSPGGRQVWPEKKNGIWDLPLQAIPFPGHSFEVLSMDYNMLANQSINSTNAPAYNYPAWREQSAGCLHIRLQAGLRDQPRPLLRGQPLRALERRHLHGRRRAGPHPHRAGEGEGRGHPPGLLPAVRRLDGRPEAGGPRQAPYARRRPGARGRLERVPQGHLRDCVERRLKCGFPPARGCARSPERACETFHMSAASRSRSRVRITLLTAGAAAAALTLSACSSGGTSGGGGDTNFIMGADGISTAKQGDRGAAPDLSGKTVDGGQLDVADHKGKVVVLNMWGSWCAPCRAEAPNLEAVYKDLKDQGVQFVGVNTRDTSVQNARAFEKDMGITFPSLYDPTGKLMLRFSKGTLNPQAVPSTLVIDRDGKIAARSLAALSESKLRKMINPVLAEK